VDTQQVRAGVLVAPVQKLLKCVEVIRRLVHAASKSRSARRCG
jgi:hypothetical protein